MGVRDLKKENTKQLILTCAKNLFFTKGYEETTTDEIAECANIGSGTIYNYFKSKAEMLIAIISDDFELAKEEATHLPMDLAMGATDLTMSFIEGYLKKFSFFNKTFMLDIVTALMRTSKKNSVFIKKIISMDFMFIERLEIFLQSLQEKKLIEKETNTKILSELIYSTILYEVMIVLLDDDAKMESTIPKIHEKVKFILLKKV